MKEKLFCGFVTIRSRCRLWALGTGVARMLCIFSNACMRSRVQIPQCPSIFFLATSHVFLLSVSVRTVFHSSLVLRPKVHVIVSISMLQICRLGTKAAAYQNTGILYQLSCREYTNNLKRSYSLTLFA